MNEKKNESFSGIFDRVIKKHIAIAVMSFFAVLIVASGVSYSLFQIDKRNTTNQTVAVGTLDANITSIAGGIVVSDLYPQKESEITDEDKKYVFTVSNTGTYDIEYEVYLKDSTDALLSSTNDYSSYKRISSEHYRYIDYKLDGRKAKNLNSIKSREKFIILKGFLAAGESEEHSIQFFLDDGDTTELGAPNDISGSVLSLDIYFEGAVGQINTMVKSDGTIWQHKTNIKTITFENTLSEKSGSEHTYNIGANEDNPVMAYMIPTGEAGTMYDVYIQAEGMIRAPQNSSNLFDGFTNLVSIEGMEYFDTSNVTDMNWMFYDCNALIALDLSSFDTSNVTAMSFMFFGCSALATLDVSNFDTSKVTDINSMFSGCKALTALDVSHFDTSNVTDMFGMFSGCKALTTLDLSNFDTSKVTSMSNMFWYCSSLTTLDVSHFDTSNVTNMSRMFYYCHTLITTLTIRGTLCTEYDNMFVNAATESGAQIAVNYTADASSLVDSMIATKHSSSNVVKGQPEAEYSITLNGVNNVTLSDTTGYKFKEITLTSTEEGKMIVSFKMNGTLINGNSFKMPGQNVIISDVVVVEQYVVESEHNPYPNSLNNKEYLNKTFEGATSLTVVLEYQTESTSFDWIYLYDKNNKQYGKYGGTTKTTETITIPGDTLRIIFRTDGSGNSYYGFKATIIPNYN